MNPRRLHKKLELHRLSILELQRDVYKCTLLLPPVKRVILEAVATNLDAIDEAIDVSRQWLSALNVRGE